MKFILFMCIKSNMATATTEDIVELIKETEDIVMSLISTTEHFLDVDVPVCNWPRPLYNIDKYKRELRHNKKSIIKQLTNLNSWLLKHYETSFMYLDSGILLGLYRDGILLEDGDIDVRFGSLDDHPSYSYPISLNDVRQWGDPWTDWGHNPRSCTILDIKRIHTRLCREPISSFMAYKCPLNQLRSTYGPLWFLRLPYPLVGN